MVKRIFLCALLASLAACENIKLTGTITSGNQSLSFQIDPRKSSGKTIVPAATGKTPVEALP